MCRNKTKSRGIHLFDDVIFFPDLVYGKIVTDQSCLSDDKQRVGPNNSYRSFNARIDNPNNWWSIIFKRKEVQGTQEYNLDNQQTNNQHKQFAIKEKSADIM